MSLLGALPGLDPKQEIRSSLSGVHEEKRGQYTNVYLDRVELAPADSAGGGAHPDTDPEEVAWRTAVEAAPWLVGDSDPHAKTGPEELYETLKPFKDKVAEDIKQSES